ncbi:MAG: hypothetical protein JXR37_29550 [Kiritimatiellae bacterium]|nr:hypothetical protein [Kiritimatiellia bacterium]
MNAVLKGVLGGTALLCAGCGSASLNVPVVKSEPVHRAGRESHAVVVMGVRLPAAFKAEQAVLYVGGERLPCKGVSAPNFSPARHVGVFNCESFTEVDAEGHAYVLWQVSRHMLKKGNRAIAYANNLYTSKNVITGRLVRTLLDAGYAAPVNVTRPGMLWYAYAPVFTLEAPGIYYLGEMSLKGADGGPNDSLQVTSTADPAKFKAFLASQNLAGAEYFDCANAWTKIRSSDFRDYTLGKK